MIGRWLVSSVAALALVMPGLVSAQDSADETSAAPTPSASDNSSDMNVVPEAMRMVEAWLDAKRAYDHVPGLSAGIVKGDRLIWSKGFGTIDAAHKVPATPDTIYSICSISKIFTSIAFMQQVEQGRARLDEPVSTYLPWAKLKPTQDASGPITMRSILSHSSGLPREFDFPYWDGPDFTFPTREQIKASFGNGAMLYPSQRYFQYSNLGLTLVGETVSELSGQNYGDYVQQHILTPLHLSDTRTSMPMDLYGKRLAVGYGAIRRDAERDLLKPFDARGVTPAAGITSTVGDLGKLLAWQVRVLRGEQAGVLLEPTLREMQRVQFVDPDWSVYRGLGFSVWHIKDQTFVGHNGECPGYYTAMTLHPASETGVVVMMNAAQATKPYVLGIFDILRKRQELKAPDAAPAQVNLEDYSGHYTHQPWDPEVVLMPWGGYLAYLELPSDNPGQEITLLKPEGGDLFRRVRDDGSLAEEVRFERNSRGKVSRIVWHTNSIDRVPGET